MMEKIEIIVKKTLVSCRTRAVYLHRGKSFYRRICTNIYTTTLILHAMDLEDLRCIDSSNLFFEAL